jgi:hypothetical protein
VEHALGTNKAMHRVSSDARLRLIEISQWVRQSGRGLLALTLCVMIELE